MRSLGEPNQGSPFDTPRHQLNSSVPSELEPSVRQAIESKVNFELPCRDPLDGHG